MSPPSIARLGSLKDVTQFQEYLHSLNLSLPCDRELMRGANLRCPNR